MIRPITHVTVILSNVFITGYWCLEVGYKQGALKIELLYNY